MLEAMRQLALDTLWIELDGGKSPEPEQWYQELRTSNLGLLFPKLVEDVVQEGGKEKQRYYTLQADPQQSDIAILLGHELKVGDAPKLPFNQPSGAQSAALGPVIKRSAPSKAKEAGPSIKIQQTTLKSFEKIAGAAQPWSSYFQSARECFLRPKIEFNSEVKEAPAGSMQAAIELIKEKRTVLLVYQDEQGRLPGEVPEYVSYLQKELSQNKYATGQVPSVEDKTCSLCGAVSVTVYPNSLRGAGINLANLDRDGAFPGLDPLSAWKSFALCVGCSDLLYIYWNHVAKDYLTSIAGYNALVIPTLRIQPASRKKFAKRLREWVDGLSKVKDSIPVREKQLLNILGEDQAAISALTILWAEFGQRIDDIRGVVSDILPSRLQKLVEYNRAIKVLPSPIFPELFLDEFEYNLPLTILKPLFRRPGGKAAEKSNESRRLFDLRRDLAESIYHAGSLPARFFDETHKTARWHFEAVSDSGNVWGLLNEGRTKDDRKFLTIAGWVRELARFLHYLKLIGVPMSESVQHYQTGCAALKPYCGPETAITSPRKAFAFILGALYGKMIQVQAARGVNVVSNALTWLKRLTLSGKDLPELYVKVREKMMLYGVEGNETVRQLVEELGELGTKLGTDIDLDETQTCYFLLLGQSLATKIMPSKQGTSDKGEIP